MMKTKFTLIIDDILRDFLPGDKFLLSYLNDFESNEWRYGHFVRFVLDSLCATALSKMERDKLPTSPMSAMSKAAKNLRISDELEKSTSGLGSELAEILLYGIMNMHYKALPVVPKIYYKQNTRDTAKGADSVHIVIENDRDFSLWYGEAKFYADLDDAITSAISSVKDTISDDKLRKENSLVTSMSDLEKLVTDRELYNSISTMLSSDTSLDRIKPILHIPILLLHECQITARHSQMTEEYCDEMKSFYETKAQVFFKRLNRRCVNVPGYEHIAFHLILFPVPNKDHVVKRFYDFAKALRED